MSFGCKVFLLLVLINMKDTNGAGGIVLMKIFRNLLIILGLLWMVSAAYAQETRLKVVTTLPDYAYIARYIGGDRVEVKAIVHGEQDAHYIRPKPSFVDMVRQADVLIDTGLDLEMWLPTVVNKSGNTKVRSGQVGYVAVAHGMHLLEKPNVISRSEGGVHLYGNPHINTSPINMRVVARNIASGLIKNDPNGSDYYKQRLQGFLADLDKQLFGEHLVEILDGETLCQLTQSGKLISFLKKQNHQSKPLIDYLGGWMKEMMPLRGKALVSYHDNWRYFFKLFGIEGAGTIEPKPGIPPSPKHVLALTKMMRERDIGIILAANYFDQQKVKAVADRVDAKAVIVPFYVGGAPGVDSYFALMDYWTQALLSAAGIEKGNG